ncbi:hypothetical protein, unlikely [Trypanosoma congolense IL3000]|uniref:Uncharacterized protein n=1 Tax=Trypanosoma congolense (strain IL3000) TaxID=1068625 RepID=F9WJW2_TRYCI|nr:hypothetical protein, unlikely [Trypanosoma congolense IL3000]
MALSCIEALATRRKGRASGAVKLPADGVTKNNQTAASFGHAAVGRVSVCSVGHPKGRNPINTAFVFLRHQKPKLGRALEKRQVHVEHQKARRLKQMGEKGCQTVAPLSEAALRDIKRKAVGYLLQYFTRTQSFIGIRRSNIKAE